MKLKGISNNGIRRIAQAVTGYQGASANEATEILGDYIFNNPEEDAYWQARAEELKQEMPLSLENDDVLYAMDDELEAKYMSEMSDLEGISDVEWRELTVNIIDRQGVLDSGDV